MAAITSRASIPIASTNLSALSATVQNFTLFAVLRSTPSIVKAVDIRRAAEAGTNQVKEFNNGNRPV